MRESLTEFSGCDNSIIEAGSKDNPAIWLFGLEPGTYKSKHDENEKTREIIEDEDYSIKTQMKWSYNQKAFKLLSAMDKQYGVEKYKKFANDFQPFVVGNKNFFKGNLYPFPCKSIKNWSDKAAAITGANSKFEYQNWCKENRLPEVTRWVEKYQPKLFIGVGISQRNEFSKAVFGESVKLDEHQFQVNSHIKRIFYKIYKSRKLVVVPHFSGQHGLNSNESLKMCGEFITKKIIESAA